MTTTFGLNKDAEGDYTLIMFDGAGEPRPVAAWSHLIMPDHTTPEAADWIAATMKYATRAVMKAYGVSAEEIEVINVTNPKADS